VPDAARDLVGSAFSHLIFKEVCMQLRYTQVLAGMRQCQRFLDANGTPLAEVNSSGARTEFDDVTARLSSFAEAQETHRINMSGELSNERRLARSLRRNHMRPIVRVARSKVPAAAQLSAVSLPPIRSNNTDTATRARAMATAVVPYKQLLHEGGLPADFIDQLNAATATLEEAVGKKTGHRRGRVGSTEGITNEVGEVRLQLNVMDAFVRKHIDESDSTLGEWASIVKSIRSALKSHVAAATASAPTPTGSGPTGSGPTGAPTIAPTGAPQLTLVTSAPVAEPVGVEEEVPQQIAA
jgi:hypothetical protein